MAGEIPAEALQLRSLVRAENMLELFLDTVAVPEPGPNERAAVECPGLAARARCH
jgi:hypothetical protein